MRKARAQSLPRPRGLDSPGVDGTRVEGCRQPVALPSVALRERHLVGAWPCGLPLSLGTLWPVPCTGPSPSPCWAPPQPRTFRCSRPGGARECAFLACSQWAETPPPVGRHRGGAGGRAGAWEGSPTYGSSLSAPGGDLPVGLGEAAPVGLVPHPSSWPSSVGASLRGDPAVSSPPAFSREHTFARLPCWKSPLGGSSASPPQPPCPSAQLQRGPPPPSALSPPPALLTPPGDPRPRSDGRGPEIPFRT